MAVVLVSCCVEPPVGVDVVPVLTVGGGGVTFLTQPPKASAHIIPIASFLGPYKVSLLSARPRRPRCGAVYQSVRNAQTTTMRGAPLLSAVVDGRGAPSNMGRLRSGLVAAVIALAMVSGCAKRPTQVPTKVDALSGPHFKFGSADLTADGQTKVWNMASTLNRYPNRRVEVIGYADSNGTDEHNQSLSERRANTVTEALIRFGVSANRITTRGYGSANPVASNATAEGRAQNRRVEIILE
jgi:outer membrane protein OmpA-like peptidoglycan-associated protein